MGDTSRTRRKSAGCGAAQDAAVFTHRSFEGMNSVSCVLYHPNLRSCFHFGVRHRHAKVRFLAFSLTDPVPPCSSSCSDAAASCCCETRLLYSSKHLSTS